MLRNFAAALALVLVSQTVFGLGLGTLKQSSALNEPFDGRVEILGANARDAETVTVKLADETQFERAGVLRNAVLLQLRFTVVDGGAKDYIQITSREPIREPFLNFLLELNWANGRVVREYTVLLDPPLYDPVQPRATAQPAPAAEPVVEPAAEPVAEMTAPPEPMAEPVPEMTTEAPTSSPMTPATEPGAILGTVQTNDTLWSLASSNVPEPSTSVQQMMLALLRANPEAFGDGNINILKRGAVLRMPEQDDLNALSRSEAIAEVQRQHQLWNDYRGVVTESVAEAPLAGDMPIEEEAPEFEAVPEQPEIAATDEVAETEDVAEPEEIAATEEVAETAEESDPRLELVAPGSDDEQMGAGDGETGEADVTLTREELDAQVQANAELQARIAEADEIIDLMRRQVDIKDDELAALQARLAELGIDAPADLLTGLAGAGDDMEADEIVDEELVDEEPMVDGPDGPPVDEDHVVMVPQEPADDVDITIGEPEVTEPEDDFEVAVTPDEGDGVIAVDDGGGGDEAGGALGGLIPAHITNMVPGGAMTVLGVAGAVLLAILVGLFKMLGGRKEEAAEEAVGIAAEAAEESAVTEFAEEDEPITETREGDEEPVIGADEQTLEAEAFVADVPPEMQATSPDLQATIETSAEELTAPAPQAELEDDPLEEVNVYLAYERFDQAEELVRKVIGDHPDEHKYKLRLLEVYYSSNDKAAYEEAARELHEAVDEDDPLWESAVAMWAEMSPERALFEEGAVEEQAPPAADAASAFVDITAEDDAAGAKTMSMAPGSDSVLESTQVGLAPFGDEEEGEGALDFDLGADTDVSATDAGDSDDGVLDLTDGMEEAGGDEVLDLTAATSELGVGDDVFDLTATTDDSVLDLTAAADEAPDEGGLDFTLDEEPASADVLDIGADTSDLAEGDALLDVTTPELGDGHDLLDVTKTGDLAGGESEDLLNVTSPGLMGGDEPNADDDVLDISGDGSSIDFDISDTVAPAFDAEAEAAPDAGDEMFDITTGKPTDAGGDHVLDFDIGGLGDDDETAEFAAAESDSDTLDITGGSEAEIEADAREMLEDSLELDIPENQEDSIDTVEMEAIPLEDTQGESEEDTGPLDTDTVPKDSDVEADAAADFDLSLQSAELDELSIGADTVGEDTAPAGDDESEIEFDLALQDTTEMDSLVIDDTLELPKTREPDETLDDLTKSMEESMAELDIGDDDLDLDDEGELDLNLADTTSGLDLGLDDTRTGPKEDAPSLDFDINDLDIGEMDQADTVAMDLNAPEETPAVEETVIIPVDETVEVQSDADEIDTKLNLAKAYIELGDNDGARSILDEVARDGSAPQQAEAQRLIEQIG